MAFMEKVFGDLNEREIKKIGKTADKIEAFDKKMQALSDEELQAKTQEFKERLKNGETLDDILPEAFAVCREASVRTLGMKPFRVQLMGGVVLHQGRIAEMQTGEGKAVPYDTPIPTPEGWKTARDIKLGDYVFGNDGKPTKVIGVYPQGEKDIYELTLRDGRTIKCAPDHLWTVFDYKDYKQTITTLEMYENQEIERGYRYHLPTSKPVEYSEKELPLDPYVLGAFLGNGCKNRTGVFELSSNDEETMKYISNLLGGTYRTNKNNYNCFFYSNEKIIHILERTGSEEIKTLLSETYSFEKYIPEIYKVASAEQRWELIKGLFDTDGNIYEDLDKKRYNIQFSTTSLKLRDDVMEILYSLGISCSWCYNKRAGEGNAKHDQYQIKVNAPNEIKHRFFRLSRKKRIAEKAASYKKAKDYSKIAIKKIEKLEGKCEQVCFAVDNAEHLFLVGNYIVTHNTLVATLPVYLNALTGKGVHVVTVNDYLAKRDADEMGKCYNFLGLSVGCLVHGIDEEERKAAYKADITYGTNNEFGFDYLKDNMVISKDDIVQRELNYAIVDEVDSILIDEARTPLIISGEGKESTEMYTKADGFIRTLTESDYNIEEKDKQVALSESGVAKCERYFGIENFADPDNMEIAHHVQQALKAHTLMIKDIDYIVQDGEIIIVDEFTGRLMYGRRFSDGLHQAIEAKEHIEVRSEQMTLATITLQNYFRMYQKLAGMTGTAKTEEAEFREIYNMDVVTVPTNKPVIRKDLPDAVYGSEEGKYKAIIEKILEAHKTGQPVLVGTVSVEKSELIADMLRKKGVHNFNVLNAKHHDKEAAIVAEAGRENAITIATNMAGRGTDIMLGGNPEFAARKELLKKGYDEDMISYAASYLPTDNEEILEIRKLHRALSSKFEEERQEEKKRVIDSGGLFVLGTERHESRRIDNQLRGRSGRQGDPGKTQFCVSLEDDLLRLFGGERMQAMAGKMGLENDEPIESGMVSRSIENAQKKVEGRNFSIRKYVLQYDNVMNKQREIIYAERKMVLDGEDLSDFIRNMTDSLIREEIEPIVLTSKYPEEWDLAPINNNLKKITEKFEGVDYENQEDLTEEQLFEDISDDFRKIYEDKEKEYGADIMRHIERDILLRVVDQKWMDHIDAMDQLKNGIGLRGLGGQDPAGAYAEEGFAMFEEMTAAIQEDTVKHCYNVVVKFEEPPRRKTVQIAPPVKPEFKRKKKIGRNEPCPCGSGKKYKFCCGRNV